MPEVFKVRLLHNTYRQTMGEGRKFFEKIFEKSCSLYGLTGRAKGSSRQPSISKTPEMKSEKKSHHQRNLPHLRHSDSKLSAINPCVFYKVSCRDKVYSSKPPKVREVSTNAKSILRGQAIFKSFYFSNFLPV